jgi:tetratricopeptide (TPR) repeat protein
MVDSATPILNSVRLSLSPAEVVRAKMTRKYGIRIQSRGRQRGSWSRTLRSAFRFFAPGWLAAAATLVISVGCQYSGQGQNAQGVRYFQQGQTDAAMREFQGAVTTNPRNADAYYNLAASYHYLGRSRSDESSLEQAENLYHQCLDLEPNHVACHRALAVLLVDSGRPQSAFTLLRGWAERNPRYSEPRIELARLHEEFSEPREARRYLTEAIDINPRDPRAWTALANLRERDGQLAQALNNYEQAYRLNSDQPGVAQKIASLQQRLARNPNSPNGSRDITADNSRGWERQ